MANYTPQTKKLPDIDFWTQNLVLSNLGLLFQWTSSERFSKLICFSLRRRPRSSRLSVEKQWSLCPVVHILERAAEKGGATASQGQGRVTNTPVMNERCDRGEDLSEVLSPTHSGRSAGLVLPPHGTRTPLMSSPEGWW